MRQLFLVGLIATGLRADIYEVIRVTPRHHGGLITAYKYGRQGSLRLWEPGDFRNRHIVIWNEERKAVYELNPDTHQYLEPWRTDWVALLARWIARPRNHESGKTVDIYYETIDTGQRRQILGHTARHLRFRERHVAAPGACNPSSSIEDDGWYIAFPERDPGSLRTISLKPIYDHYESRESYACRDTVIKHGEPYPGLLVLQEKNAFTLEVVALSAAPLDKSLFEVPSDYKKVDHFKGTVPPTWTDKLSWDRSQLIDSIATWF